MDPRQIKGALLLSVLTTAILLSRLPIEKRANITLVAETPGVIVEAAGEVRRPGIHKLPKGSKLKDLIPSVGLKFDPALIPPEVHHLPLKSGQKFTFRMAEGVAVTLMSAEARLAHLIPININTAKEEELEALPGIGPVRARAIVDYRDKHGPFKRVEDLDKVKGIGPKTILGIRGLVTVEEDN